MAREVNLTNEQRWEDLNALRNAYPSFQPFLYDVMTELLGFQCSPIQLDICDWLEHGPLYRMVQAQRGQAKTTITAAYAVWRLIHNPSARILIVSAGGDMAAEIANWVIQIVMGMDILECLRPNKAEGDRAAVKSFDIHNSLKGPEKSPSVACMGITSNMQGKRADVLIADDIESAKNSATELQREKLRHLTKDFTSICSKGDIIYLGTPQSIDSIYNGLIGRGYAIRVWTGRYPTVEEQGNYGNCLAPMITRAVEENPSLRTGGGPTGDRGQATDTVICPEEALIKKEIDQGKAYFQLQHMLDTRLMDADKYPLKTEDLIFARLGLASAPSDIHVLQADSTRIMMPNDFPLESKFYRAAGFGDEFLPFTGTHMYVDPAGGGQNGDETAYAVTKFSAGRVFLVDAGGVKGGVGQDSLDALTKIAEKWKPNQISIEKNYGNGALSNIWQPHLLKVHKCHIDDVWETGQKELRIIDILEPVIGSGRLVIDEGLLTRDWQTVQDFPVAQRSTYSLFCQMSRITRDKDSLIHDDRLDAVAGSVRHWVDHLKQDKDKATSRAKAAAYRELMKNPLGNGRPVPGFNKHRAACTATAKVARKF